MPPRVKFELPREGTTEIRIHGVGGTGPDAILGDPHPQQVAGDGKAGFFRPSNADPKIGPAVEAYSWGGLTSQKATRALWILLLPFTLTNVAGWMVVRSSSAMRLTHAQERLCRVMALLASILMIVGIAAVTGDLISVQCGRSAACRSGRWWLGFLGTETFEQPLRRLSVGMLPAIVVLAFLIRRSLESRKEYEEFSPVQGQAGNPKTEAGEDANLASPNFWHRPTLVRNLTALHLAGTLSYLSYLLSESIAEVHKRQLEVPTWVNYHRFASLIALGITVVWTLLLRWKRGPMVKNPLSRWFHWGFALLVMLLFVATWIRAWLVVLPYPARAALQTFRRAPIWLLMACVILALAIALIQILAGSIDLFHEIRSLPFQGRLPVAIRRLLPWLVLVPTVAVVILVDFRLRIVYALLPILLLAAIVMLRAWVPALIAFAGFAMLPLGWIVDEKPWLHTFAVFAVLTVLLMIHDWTWPRSGFRWGAPPVMALFGIVLLGAIIAGGSTRVADLLDKRQSSVELGGAVLQVLDRNYESEFNQAVLTESQEQVQRLYETGPATRRELDDELLRVGIPSAVSRRLLAALGKNPPLHEVMAALKDSYENVGFSRGALFGARKLVKDAYDLPRTAKDLAYYGTLQSPDLHKSPVPAEDLTSELSALTPPVPPSVISRIYLATAQGDQRPIDLELPNAYQWLTVGISGSFLLSLLAMGCLYLGQKNNRPLPVDYREPETRSPGARDLNETEEKRLRKRVVGMQTLKEIAGAGDLLITYIVGLLVLGAAISFVVYGDADFSLRRWMDEPFATGWERLLGPSEWFVTALPLIGIAVIRKSYSNEASRRKIGIVWDIATFWPRRFHPLAPPAYSERAVPELQQRLRQASVLGKGVILAAHSQGSVVGYASLLPLEGRELARITLVTYGSPLGSYYRRFFPTFFRIEDFDALEERLQAGCQSKYAWCNFWRPTDPIAGCVFTDQESQSDNRDKKVVDPWWWWRIPGQPLPHLQVHSDYMDDPELRDWINAAGGRIDLWKSPGNPSEGPSWAGAMEAERWAGRAEERFEDRQNPLIHIAPHPDVQERGMDERANERVEVVEPDGTSSRSRRQGPGHIHSR